ncbi:hypothetical protein HYT23_03700 [Candidatus Pacearchaeota archaeon]|nr:hypothetical protein [Candidatus Pacearchaeota archaeon]
MIKSKKAQIFTIISIFLLVLMFASFEIISILKDRRTINDRVSSMENFLSSIEKNLGRQMYIAGYRIIFLAEAEVYSSPGYINASDFFNEAFFNGTVNGIENQSFLIGVVYDDILSSINNKAAKINVDISLANSFINVTQSDPWSVNFSMTSDFKMSDRSGLAYWNKKQMISAMIPITEFEDPVFVKGAFTRIPRKIIRTPFEGTYFDVVSFSNISAQLSEGYYSNNSDAPNFLKRLEGDFSPDPNGIESFVDVAKLVQQGISPEDKSVIDHIYFSGNNPVATQVDSSLPNWFKLDDEHKKRYQIP